MDKLVQFLRDQLDEDEEVTRAATQGDWVWSREFVTPPGYHHRTIGPLEPGDAVHISRQSPARVLAEIEAKRATIRDYEKALKKRDEKQPNTPAYRHWDNRSYGLLMALRHAAAVYADRPGYKEAVASVE